FPVHGEVYFDGQPASGAMVHFHPLNDEERAPAFAEVKADGSFELSTFGTNDGAEEGDYVVTVNWRTEERVDGDIIVSPDRMGERYAKRELSTLKATVTEGDNLIPCFELSEKDPVPVPKVVAPRSAGD